MPEILILVLSARRQPWGMLMDASMETWDKEENEQTETLYYCGNVGQSTDNIFYSQRWTEDLVDVSPRTLEAFERALERRWDYLARPNSSCYVHKRNLVSFAESLPRENVCYGILTEGTAPFLWGGCQYIFSRDVIEKLVTNPDKWNTGIMEDESISYAAQSLGIPTESKIWTTSINMQDDGLYLCMTYNHGDNFYFKSFDELPEKAAGHFFFRVKQDSDRSQDVRIMRELKRVLP